MEWIIHSIFFFGEFGLHTSLYSTSCSAGPRANPSLSYYDRGQLLAKRARYSMTPTISAFLTFLLFKYQSLCTTTSIYFLLSNSGCFPEIQQYEFRRKCGWLCATKYGSLHRETNQININIIIAFDFIYVRKIAFYLLFTFSFLLFIVPNPLFGRRQHNVQGRLIWWVIALFHLILNQETLDVH